MLKNYLNIIFKIDIRTKSFTCSNAGVNCHWTASSENEEDLLNKIKAHARIIHDFKEISSELYEKVKNTIK
jgi:predicted small metal-binding protein